MLRSTLLAGVVLLIALPAEAQQTGFYGGTAQERRFARDLYEAQQESGIEYVSVSFRLATLTLYPTKELYESWLGDEEVATETLGDFARTLLEKVRERKRSGEIKVQVKIRYPNERRSYEKIVAILTSSEGLDGEVELIIKGEAELIPR
jgi:hypothetical protein